MLILDQNEALRLVRLQLQRAKQEERLREETAAILASGYLWRLR